MVTSSTRKRKQSQHSSVSNKRTNTKTQSPSTANQVQCNNTTINQQLKLISVTSSAECSDLTDISVQNQQQIRNMESEIAKLKQQNVTLLTQRQQTHPFKISRGDKKSKTLVQISGSLRMASFRSLIACLFDSSTFFRANSSFSCFILSARAIYNDLQTNIQEVYIKNNTDLPTYE